MRYVILMLMMVGLGACSVAAPEPNGFAIVAMDPVTGEVVWKVTLDKPVTVVAFSPDGQSAVTGPRNSRGAPIGDAAPFTMEYA